MKHLIFNGFERETSLVVSVVSPHTEILWAEETMIMDCIVASALTNV